MSRAPSVGADTTRRALIGSLAALGIGACPASRAAGSAGPELRALTAGDTSAVRQILAALVARFPSLVHGTDARALIQKKGAAVFIAIGPAALTALLDAGVTGPVISLFTSAQTFDRVFQGETTRQRFRRQATAIFADASPRSQFELIRNIFQRRVLVGVMLSQATAHLESSLKREAARASVELLVHTLPADSNPVRELNALAAAAAVLAIPDSAIYTQDNLRNIIESCYRRGQPIIGFSPSMVTAGTLATAYSSVEDVIAQLEEVVAEIERGRLPEPQYPAYWRVQVNSQVARSLNVVIDEAVSALGTQPPRTGK